MNTDENNQKLPKDYVNELPARMKLAKILVFLFFLICQILCNTLFISVYLFKIGGSKLEIAILIIISLLKLIVIILLVTFYFGNEIIFEMLFYFALDLFIQAVFDIIVIMCVSRSNNKPFVKFLFLDNLKKQVSNLLNRAKRRL